MNQYITSIPTANEIGIHHQSARDTVNGVAAVGQQLLGLQIKLYQLQKAFSTNLRGGPEVLFNEFLSNVIAQSLHLQQHIENEVVALQGFLAFMSGQEDTPFMVCRDETTVPKLGTAGYDLIAKMRTNLDTDALRSIRDNLNYSGINLWAMLSPVILSFQLGETTGARFEGLSDFADQVGYGQEWDYKQYVIGAYGEQIDLIEGDPIAFDHFANIHYGFIGRAASLDREVLLMGAGAAQFKNDYSQDKVHWDWSSTYFDDPRDREAIMMGMDLYDRYGADFTNDEFLEVYRGYQDKLRVTN